MNAPLSKPPPRPAAGPRRVLYLVLGSFFVGVAMLGIVLPVLPTTPFLLIAAYFLSRSSPRFYRWLLRNRRFGPLIHQWRVDRSLPPGIKPKAIALVLCLFAISIWLMRGTLWVQALLIGIGIALVVFLARLPQRELAKELERLSEGEG